MRRRDNATRQPIPAWVLSGEDGWIPWCDEHRMSKLGVLLLACHGEHHPVVRWLRDRERLP